MEEEPKQPAKITFQPQPETPILNVIRDFSKYRVLRRTIAEMLKERFPVPKPKEKKPREEEKERGENTSIWKFRTFECIGLRLDNWMTSTWKIVFVA